MAIYALKDCKVYVGKFDMTGYTNSISLSAQRAAVDKTVFGDDTKHATPGLESVELSHEGYWESGAAGQPGLEYWTYLGAANVPVTVCPTDGTVAEYAYTFQSLETTYNKGAAVGEMFPYSISAVADKAVLVRGQVLAASALTTTATGTAVQVGAASATQKVYAALHVTAVSGTSPTLDVIVESDDSSGFASATSRITFSQKTSVVYDWQEVAGPITDDWWRISFTIGGTTPSFTTYLIVGIR